MHPTRPSTARPPDETLRRQRTTYTAAEQRPAMQPGTPISVMER